MDSTIKRTLTILSIVILFNIVIFKLNTYAKVGDVIGKIYSTDIVCDIDGMKIPSYNIGGETAINVEELRNYGFDVKWSEEDRKLYVTTMELPDIVPEYELSKSNNVGQMISNIYETDIKVYFNSYLVNPEKTYNIGGKTLVSVEELGNKDSNYMDSNWPELFNAFEANGYSKYIFKSEWSEVDRTISLKSLRPKDIISSDIGNMRIKSIESFSGFIDGLEIQNYCNFIDLINELNLEYTFKDNILCVKQSKDSKNSYEQEIYGTNMGIILSSLATVTVNTPSGEKINGFISFGKFSLKLEDFAKLAGYNYYEESNPIRINRISKK